jgi:lysophospholipase L1-like esterase
MQRITFIFSLLLAVCLLVHPATAQGETPPIKVACIGDSITFGAGIKDRKQNNYPVQLQKILGDTYTVHNFGVNAATLLKNGNKPYWKLNQFKAAQELQPDIVVIKLGTNDTKPDNWKHKDEYQPDYLEMIAIFQKLESKPKVYICTPAPVVGERWGISDKTVREEVIPLIHKIAERAEVSIIDLYSPLKDKPELMPDQVHPNAEGAGIIAKTVAASISDKPKED